MSTTTTKTATLGMGNRSISMGSAIVSKPTEFETRQFIDNEYIDGSAGKFLDIENPFDGSFVTKRLHCASNADVDAAVAAARKAFNPWAAIRGEVRRVLLLKFADLIERDAEKIAALESLCGGTAYSFMKSIHVPFCVRTLRYYAGWCDKMEGESFPADNGYMRIIRHELLGVCAAIIAFNGPVIMFAMKAGPALASGNCLVIKPSEKSPLSLLYLAQLAQEASFPPGVLNVINGDGAVGAAIASHADIDKLSFTGSVAVAKKIAALALASNLKKVTFELGGKSPSIVFPDANLNACVASSRIYVHHDIKDLFLSRLKENFKSIHHTYGDPFDQQKTNEPLVDRVQHKRVLDLMELGKQQATLVTGGERIPEPSYFVQPTIFYDPAPNARVYKEEIFGPVVVVNSFNDEEDVIRSANETEYGLAGTVFTQDINRAMRIAGKIRAGTVGVNYCGIIDPQVPFRGFKQSGIG